MHRSASHEILLHCRGIRKSHRGSAASQHVTGPLGSGQLEGAPTVGPQPLSDIPWMYCCRECLFHFLKYGFIDKG